MQAEYLWRVYKNRPIRPSIGVTELQKLGDSANPSTISIPTAVGWERITKKIGHMIIGMAVAALFIYIRSIYRTIELLDGWSGPIIQNETLFSKYTTHLRLTDTNVLICPHLDVLDGMMIFLALFTLSVFHPGRLLWDRCPTSTVTV